MYEEIYLSPHPPLLFLNLFSRIAYIEKFYFAAPGVNAFLE